MKALTFLAPLEDSELQLLADGLSYVPFNLGEVVTRIGTMNALSMSPPVK